MYNNQSAISVFSSRPRIIYRKGNPVTIQNILRRRRLLQKKEIRNTIYVCVCVCRRANLNPRQPKYSIIRAILLQSSAGENTNILKWIIQWIWSSKQRLRS